MASKKAVASVDPEFAAISAVYEALSSLDVTSQRRVLSYVMSKLGIETAPPESSMRMEDRTGSGAADSDASRDSDRGARASQQGSTEADTDGISAVALKWMRRSGLDSSRLGDLYSLGVDDIDLVVKSVPGKTKKDRMLSVILLKGIAAYLSTGVARVSHAHVKEACLHYDAYDQANFAKHLRSFSPEVSGDVGSGFTLTPRGLTRATETIKSMLGSGE
ncbi:MAG: hypothetical protein IPK26_12130 [Planctomycetes bacterium]|nr:hypothetical protein [Planctomycetota bacterium]